jgi:hypothetical protein
MLGMGAILYLGKYGSWYTEGWYEVKPWTFGGDKAEEIEQFAKESTTGVVLFKYNIKWVECVSIKYSWHFARLCGHHC